MDPLFILTVLRVKVYNIVLKNNSQDGFGINITAALRVYVAFELRMFKVVKFTVAYFIYCWVVYIYNGACCKRPHFCRLLSCEKTTKTYLLHVCTRILTNVLPYSPPLIILKMKFLDKINKLLLTISKDAWEEIRLAIQGTFQL